MQVHSVKQRHKEHEQWNCLKEQHCSIPISLSNTQPAHPEGKIWNTRQRHRDGSKLYMITFLTKQMSGARFKVTTSPLNQNKNSDLVVSRPEERHKAQIQNNSNLQAESLLVTRS